MIDGGNMLYSKLAQGAEPQRLPDAPPQHQLDSREAMSPSTRMDQRLQNVDEQVLLPHSPRCTFE